MHEGMVSVRSEEEQESNEEHEPLTARDLEMLNEGLGEEGVASLRNLTSFLANARRQGLKVDRPLEVEISFDLEGDSEQVRHTREEADQRELVVSEVRELTGSSRSYITIR